MEKAKIATGVFLIASALALTGCNGDGGVTDNRTQTGNQSAQTGTS